MIFLQATAAPQEVNYTSIIMFLIFVGITMYITYWAAKKTKTTSEFFTAGGNISGFQNGLALAGDYMSAASFLGIAGMVAIKGYDGLIYSIGFLVGWPLIMFLIAEPLRNLGKFTFADVLANRLKQRPIRIASAIGSITTITFYLIAQMVGAGKLIQQLFSFLDYNQAVILVGIVMTMYVLFGGMLATTWVQIIKAMLLLGGATIIVILTLHQFNYNPLNLFNAAVAKQGIEVLSPGSSYTNPWDLFSLGIALILGTAGLPHILMRFYTVPDAKQARLSVFYATGFIGYFYILTFIIGFGAMVLVGKDAIVSADKSGTMAALMLANATGGAGFMGFIAAVAFATILAVVAGLTLSGASILAHDIYINVIKKGDNSNEQKQIKVARMATLALGLLSILLGLLFKPFNVAFMVSLAFAIAASANFPTLLLSLLWKKYTTTAAVASITTGAATCITLIVLSPTVWVKILEHPEPVFPLEYPAIISLPAALLVGIVVSLFTKDKEAEEKFEQEKVRTYLGTGA